MYLFTKTVQRAVEFGGLVTHHWTAWLTGSVIALTLVIIDRLTNWRLPKWFYAVVVGGTLVVSAFQAWQDENTARLAAEASLQSERRAWTDKRIALENEIKTLKQQREATASPPCPPNSMTFVKGENVLMDPGPGQRQRVWGLSEGLYRPPGATSPFSARITVMGPESILWSDDGGPPNRVAMVNAELWICGDRVAKFRARPNGINLAALTVSYVR